MRLGGSLLDLVAQAERRARLAGVLGRLLLAEPDEDVAEVVAAVPSLAPLAAGGAELASDFERLLLREVPAYESVFLGEDGARGGDLPAVVAAVYGRHGFDEAGRWRVADVDHLGLELRFLGHLCAEEAAAWSDDRPEDAARVVEAERELLAVHLGRWGQVAAAAVRDAAGPSPYGRLAEAVAELVAEECERLRPDPDHPGRAPIEARRPPERLGPARLARWLLAPSACGAWLPATTLGAAAVSLGIPWRPSDPRSRFRQVAEAAADGGDLPDLLLHLRPAVERWRDRHAVAEAGAPGAARTWRGWRLQAEETLALIDRLASSASVASAGPQGPVVVVVAGPGHDMRTDAAVDVLDRLRPLGATVAVSADLRPRLAGTADRLLRAGAEDVLLAGDGVSAVVFRDGGGDAQREAFHLGGAQVVVRLVPGTGPVSVTVEDGGDATLSERVRRSLPR